LKLASGNNDKNNNNDNSNNVTTTTTTRQRCIPLLNEMTTKHRRVVCVGVVTGATAPTAT
jgi:hypothetical protein